MTLIANSVIKEWVFTLPYRMQSVLVVSLRGCDIARKDDPSKFITRGLRGLTFNNADPTNSFITDKHPDAKMVKQFLWDMDRYPMHFVMHTAHAAEIVGYKHPESKHRKWWLGFYKKVVLGLHLNFETEDQLDTRLGFTPAEMKIRKAAEDKAADDQLEAVREALKQAKSNPEHKWDAGTGTSHGDRSRLWSGSS